MGGDAFGSLRIPQYSTIPPFHHSPSLRMAARSGELSNACSHRTPIEMIRRSANDLRNWAVLSSPSRRFVW